MLIHDMVQNRKENNDVEGRQFPQKLGGDVCIHEAGPFVLIEHIYVLSNGQTTHIRIDSENETLMLSRQTLDEIPFGAAQIK